MHFPLELDMSIYCDQATYGYDISQEGEYTKLDEPKVDSQSASLYELFAIVIHRGKTALHGHYHAYIRDLYQSSESRVWFDFDDSTVSLIEETKLVDQFGGANECACTYQITKTFAFPHIFPLLRYVDLPKETT